MAKSGLVSVSVVVVVGVVVVVVDGTQMVVVVVRGKMKRTTACTINKNRYFCIWPVRQCRVKANAALKSQQQTRKWDHVAAPAVARPSGPILAHIVWPFEPIPCQPVAGRI